MLHGDNERYYDEKGNTLLMRKAGTVPVFVKPEGIPEAMDEAMIKLKERDYTPFRLQGGGHSFAGARACVKAVTGNILF